MLAALILASCGLTREAGSFSLSLNWEEEPTESVWVWIRVEERESPETAGTILGSSGPDEYVPGEPFAASIGQVDNGENRYLVVEVREGPSSGLPVLYYGVSDPFSIFPGEHTQVNVPLKLDEPETETHEPSVELLFNGKTADAAGLAAVKDATIRTRSVAAIAVQLANDASFGANLTTVTLGDAGDVACTIEEMAGVSWDVCEYTDW